MKISDEMMYVRCLAIESMVRDMVIRGTTDNEELVKAIDTVFHPETSEEMERYSEAIIYAKQAVLN